MPPLGSKVFEKKSHKLSVEVYSDLVKVAVIMNQDEYMEMIPFGIDYERLGINGLLKKIFDTEFKGQLIFSNEAEFQNWATGHTLPFAVDVRNDWFKLSIFNIDNSNYEESLESIIKHISTKSASYESKSTLGKADAISRILKKF